MRVLKFGGSSVTDAEAISRLAGIVQQQCSVPIVVVVSALAGITDALFRVFSMIRENDKKNAHNLLGEILERHLRLLLVVATGNSRDQAFECIEAMFSEIERLIEVCYPAGLSLATSDKVVATGELASSMLITAALRPTVNAHWIDARQVVATDKIHGCATADLSETEKNLNKVVRPILCSGQVVVVGGFVGVHEGHTTTLGRNGSDYSASVLAVGLQASEVQFWKDVDGVMTSDPRLSRKARPIPYLSYAEALSLTLSGSKILHPRAVIEAQKACIPIRVRNARNPDHPGTLISN